MPHPATQRLIDSVEGLVDAVARVIGREVRTLVHAARMETRAELRRLERRLDRLERLVSRQNRSRPGRGKAATCKRDGCHEEALARGLCSRHYQQMRYRKKARQRRR